MTMNFRYGVHFKPETGSISAGVVRKQGDRDILVTESTVTKEVIGAAALWVLVNSGNAPHRFSDGNGTEYELTVKVVT